MPEDRHGSQDNPCASWPDLTWHVHVVLQVMLVLVVEYAYHFKSAPPVGKFPVSKAIKDSVSIFLSYLDRISGFGYVGSELRFKLVTVR